MTNPSEVKRQIIKALEARKSELWVERMAEKSKQHPELGNVLQRWDDYLDGIKDAVNLISAMEFPEAPDKQCSCAPDGPFCGACAYDEDGELIKAKAHELVPTPVPVTKELMTNRNWLDELVDRQGFVVNMCADPSCHDEHEVLELSDIEKAIPAPIPVVTREMLDRLIEKLSDPVEVDGYGHPFYAQLLKVGAERLRDALFAEIGENG